MSSPIWTPDALLSEKRAASGKYWRLVEAQHQVSTMKLVDTVEESAVACNYTHMRIHSGPGHDAQYVADILPTSMIFVPSVEGHSHCELEYTPAEACAKGVDVLIQTLLSLDRKLD